jgi:hypothetical protein
MPVPDGLPVMPVWGAGQRLELGGLCLVDELDRHGVGGGAPAARTEQEGSRPLGDDELAAAVTGIAPPSQKACSSWMPRRVSRAVRESVE